MLQLCHISFVLFLIAANLDRVRTECPLGWQHYNNSCYFFSSESLNWYLAQSACRGHDARLAEIETKDRQDYITDLAKRFNHYNYWIGGRDDIIESRWIWSSTDKLLTYTNWGPNEPNGGTGENCLSIYAPWTWQWYDMTCSTSQQFICEKNYHNSEEIIG